MPHIKLRHALVALRRKLRQGSLLSLALSSMLFGTTTLDVMNNQAQAATASNIAQENAMISVTMDFGSHTINLQLIDNSATRDLAARLPLEVELEDFGGGAERIFYLNKTLDYSDVKAGSDATAGTVAIYRPWGNVCIFLRQGPASNDLITLGHISAQDLATLKQAKLGTVTLRRN